jgi:DNA repair exonuclease SbcCD ATPase subunit
MRFEKIHLDNIPESGLFCIQGANESGKSTLGALIYFAFSGTGPHGENAEQLISWEKSQMKLKINFEFNNRNYELQRQVDRDGSNFSKLICEGQTLARGNTPILEAFEMLFQYNPKDLDKSFLITHRVVQSFSTGPCENHLEYMLNLNPIKSLMQKGLAGEKDMIKKLEDQQQDLTKLNNEKEQIGYDRDEQQELGENLEGLNIKKNVLDKKLDGLQGQQNGLQNIQDQLAEGAKQLPSKFSEETSEQLEQITPNLLEKFSQLHVLDKAKDCLKNSTDLLKELQSYLKQSKELRHAYENNLSDMRTRLGLNQAEKPNPESLMGKTQASKQACNSSTVALRFWSLSSFFGIVIYLCMIISIILRPKITAVLKQSPDLYNFFNEGPLAGFTHSLRIWLKPSSIGIPLDPRLLATMGFIFLILVACVLAVLYYRKKLKHLQGDLDLATKEQDGLQNSYNHLLSADFKEMSEVGSIIESSDNDELIELFEKFKQDHQNIVEENYRIEPIVRLAKDHLEETQQNLSLDMHKINSELEELEKELTQLQDELKICEEKVLDMQNKQNKFEELNKKIDELSDAIQEDKKACAIQKGLAELAEGTVKHIRQRFQRALTGLFKLLMPRLTQERYGAVRVSDNFDLEVFSDERGDFVPLQLLSSGTNDLFNLIFQSLLIQAFMESRKLDHHFLFLDEPLLAVDVVRYQKLTDLLPEMSKGLKQIFLCRPPQTMDGAYVIETDLSKKDLVVDFSNLQTSVKPS